MGMKELSNESSTSLPLTADKTNRIKTTGEKGDKSVWPFYRCSDYETAQEAPPYLRRK
jgi:hypothetical protein